MPSSSRARREGIIKAPPPFWAAWTGNRRKLPRPTALPAIARMTPSWEPHASWRCCVFGLALLLKLVHHLHQAQPMRRGGRGGRSPARLLQHPPDRPRRVPSPPHGHERADDAAHHPVDKAVSDDIDGDAIV